MAIARVGSSSSSSSSSSRAINCNAYHQTGGVGRGGFGARQLSKICPTIAVSYLPKVISGISTADGRIEIDIGRI